MIRKVSSLAIFLFLPWVGCGAPTASSPPPTLADAPAPAAPPTATPLAAAPAAKPGSSAILSDPNRSAEDRALDEGRRPIELFAFAGVKPGMKVAEIGAWKGYTAELLARAVAPSGAVYAQDPAAFDEWTRDTWSARAKRAPYAHVVRVARPFEDPLPPEAAGTLDVAFVILFYHDTVWLGVDRPKMDAALFRALKPGGSLVIVDHSARPKEGVTVAKSLHRIEESVVRDELTKAGFVFAADSDLLRHPEDTHDWSASDEAPAAKRGKSDRFVLRFTKP